MRRLPTLLASPDFQAIALSLGLALLAAQVAPHVYADQALQLTAVQAWRQGISPFPNWIVTADPSDLTRDRTGWELWHPLGFPLLIALLSRAGVAFPVSLHLLGGGCFVLGCWGWVRWWRAVAGSFWVRRSAPFLVPCLRYGNDNLLHFHAEAFLFAAAPWGLLLLLPQSRTRVQSALLWGLAALLPLFKYSALLLLGGGLVAAVVCRRTGRREWLVFGAAALLPITVLMALNARFGAAANLVSASWHPHWPGVNVVELLSATPLILADAGELCVQLDPHQTRGLLTVAGVFGTLLLGWLLLAGPRSPFSFQERLVGLLFLLALTGNLLIVSLCDGVISERRYLSVFGLALLPMVLTRITRHLTEPPGQSRGLATLFLVGYLALPTASSVGRFALHWQLARTVVAGPSGLWNPILGTPNQAQVFGALHQARVAAALVQNCVWIWPEPLWALNESGRCFYPPSGQAKLSARSSRPLTILWVARDLDRAQRVAAFFQVAEWQPIGLPGTNYLLWIGHLEVPSAR